MPLSAGDRLGPYEILAPIGAGGMGEVWKARDTRLNRIVAIKRLKSEYSARFQQEARAIAALNHPHICTLHDIGPDYLVMEFIEGAALCGPIPVEQAVRLAVQIASALEEAHGRGILHRDLKPGNILVTASGIAKLLDFGLARSVAGTDATRTLEGTVSGTPAYMAPEQIEGKPCDVRSDVFSFGAVLYEMLSGRRAFQGMASVLRDDPAPPPALEGIVLRCLAKQPADRFQTIAEVKAVLESGANARPPDETRSIAVLPFANMSRDPDDEYFSDGLTEEILNVLAQVPGLKVIARTSSFAFKGKNEDVREIAHTLGVTHILEGSVRRAGGRIRVTAQLIQAADGTHLWSQRFDRDMQDVFAIQDEISMAITEQLKVRLAKRQLVPQSVAAYEAYLEGRYHALRFSPSSAAKALPCFERALALDPTYAPAHFGMAEYYWVMITVVGANASELLPKVQSAVRRALALDDSIAEANAMLGLVNLFLDYDWAGAERHIRRALQLNPASPSVTFAYGYWYLRLLGRFDEALTILDRALEQNPLSPALRTIKGLTLASSMRNREAAEELQRALDIEPNYLMAHFGSAVNLMAQRRFQEALAIAKTLARENPMWVLAFSLLGMVQARSGHPEEAHAALSELNHLASRMFVTASAFVRIYCGLGEPDSIFGWVEKAIEQRDPMVLTMKIDPGFTFLRSDPRYTMLLKKMNLV